MRAISLLALLAVPDLAAAQYWQPERRPLVRIIIEVRRPRQEFARPQPPVIFETRYPGIGGPGFPVQYGGGFNGGNGFGGFNGGNGFSGFNGYTSFSAGGGFSPGQFGGGGFYPGQFGGGLRY